MNKLNLSTKITIGVVAAIILLLGVTFPRGNPVVQQLVTGSAVGPESQNNYQCYGGICTYYYKQTMQTATTSVCHIVSPPFPTKLEHASATFSVSTTSAYLAVMATSSSQYSNATTTLYAQLASSANYPMFLVSTSSPINTNTTTDLIFATSTAINVSMSSLTAGTGISTFSPKGTCEAIFRSL